ncbi:uncharacterized protein LOC125772106 [Anopheles funestus]|uniref:uncharacterized protein LOC125772106 n=1 Tax=Anopheles funestus TaxID=62324 RepID=UPI0020C5C4E5|nr:uncharacterized protein LOC125772106 [Anopheles funestus]
MVLGTCIGLAGYETTREGLSSNETTGTTRYLADFVQTLVGAIATDLGNLSRFLNDSRLAIDVNVLELISMVHPNHDIAINSFEPAHGTLLQVHQIVTERGICYALNAPLALLLHVNGTGLLHPFWSGSKGYIVYHVPLQYAIHSPYEVATSDQLFTHVEESDELVAVYSVLETVANERLKDLTVRQRNCYFYDEVYEHLPLYSHNLCIMSCRARRALAACRCRPHFYPFAEGPPCNVQGLHCLQQHPEWYNDGDCKCLKSCTDVGYYVASLSKTQWTAEGGIPFTHKASLRWEILQPKTRLRRVLIFSYEDLLVSFGGAVALFLGKNGFYLSKIVEFLVLETFGWVRRKFCMRNDRKKNRTKPAVTVSK